VAVTSRRRHGVGQTIGGVLVGFDEQVWSHRPPADELVHHARPDDPVPAADATRITIVVPAERVPDPAPVRRRDDGAIR
jgi:hypothetical protein